MSVTSAWVGALPLRHQALGSADLTPLSVVRHQLETSLCSNLPPFLFPCIPESSDTQAGHPTPTHPWPPFYQGCMRNLMVNWAFVTLPRSARVQGAVGASGCPAT